MFLYYVTVNVLFQCCKKAGPLKVNRNTKKRKSRHQRNVPCEKSEQPTKLKISQKIGEDLMKKLLTALDKGLGKIKAISKIC